MVAGRVWKSGDRYAFNYGRSYLARDEAIPIYLPELPLQPGALDPLGQAEMAGCLRDASPDSWGRRVIVNRLTGLTGGNLDVGDRLDVDVFDEITFMLESGSDRVGALDFQGSPSVYRPRGGQAATLADLMAAAELVEQGVPIREDLGQALFHGTSIGGARPKALIEEGDRKLIAKFSSQNDVTNVVKAEFVAMRLASAVGLNVAAVRLVRTAGKDVLLIERFDRQRVGGEQRVGDEWHRKAMVSALTMQGLDELEARYASYEAMANDVRHRFREPRRTLEELYGRLVFNVLCGNTDDHARNHAAFWDGSALELTPGYDICPQARTGNEASQAMLIVGTNRSSRIASCLDAAPAFLLGTDQATEIVRRQMLAISEHWPNVCEEAGLTDVERAALWGRQFFNPSIFEGAPEPLAGLANALVASGPSADEGDRCEPTF